jgi:hypothetical protein
VHFTPLPLVAAAPSGGQPSGRLSGRDFPSGFLPGQGAGEYTFVATAFALRAGILVVTTLSAIKAGSRDSANTGWSMPPH